MKPFAPRRLIACVICMVTLGGLAHGSEFVDRHAERPTAQATSTGADAISYMQRSIQWPSDGFVQFDYFVDSEADHDSIRVYVDGTLGFEQSGHNRGGKGTIPVAAGTHIIRFAFERDASGDFGLNTAWIDNVNCFAGVEFKSFSFDDRQLGALDGWQVGGAAGGWRLTRRPSEKDLRRSKDESFLGYQATATRAAVERDFTWPTGGSKNQLSVSYAVDSEESADILKVYVDGVVGLTVSGRDKVGTNKVNVGSSGTHRIKIEYSKDESGDVGLDDARVLSLVASADDNVFEIESFDDASTGDLPDGWVVSPGATSGRGWSVAQARAPRAYLVSGQRTKINLPDYGNNTSSAVPLAMRATANGDLAIELAVPAKTPAAGSEQGSLTLLFDDKHLDTLAGLGCGPNDVAPGGEDRRIVLSYDVSTASREWTPSVVQQRGSCLGGTNAWEAVPTDELWAVTAVGKEPADDGAGLVVIDVTVALPTTLSGLTTPFGLGFEFASGNPATTLLRLPRIDSWNVIESDVSTWESVRFDNFRTAADLRAVFIDARP